MRTLFVGLALMILTACIPVRYVEVGVGYNTGPRWYTYCTWNYPCHYASDVIFVYGWGWMSRPIYAYYYGHPAYRPQLVQRPGWYPSRPPVAHGRNWPERRKERRERGRQGK